MVAVFKTVNSNVMSHNTSRQSIIICSKIVLIKNLFGEISFMNYLVDTLESPQKIELENNSLINYI